MTKEAELTRTYDGLVRGGPGWFVLNLKDARWMVHDRFGAGCQPEGEHKFEQVGVNLRVLQPGKPACLYHRENQEEHFLVLEGECKVVIEDEERPLKKWDFVHCPPGTNHVFVGAGDGPSVVLMMGARQGTQELCYPPSEIAAKYEASTKKETDSPIVAYAGTGLRGVCKAPDVIH